MAHYVHHLPGRLRIRLPQLKRNPDYGDRLQQRLRLLPGVFSVQTNPITGSLLVVYRPQTISAAALQAAIPELPPRSPDATSGRGSALSPAIGEELAQALVGTVVEKALSHSARVLLGALL